LRSSGGTLTSYGNDPKDDSKTTIFVNFEKLTSIGAIVRHPKKDVAAILIGKRGSQNVNDTKALVPTDGVQPRSVAKSGWVSVDAKTALKRYADVLISNEAFLFGYPSSIGLNESAQFDYERPLLRRGIIAGKYDVQQTIILDCPVHYGNSGGPVIEMEQIDFNKFQFWVCGVVSEYIPYIENWINEKTGITHPDISNSGYSVAVSTDSMLELLESIESQKSR